MPEAGVRSHAERIQAALQDGAAVRSTIAASWRRSALLYGLDPAARAARQALAAAELGRDREAMGPLLALAGPVMDRLFQAVGGIGCCVVLTNERGVLVERRGAGGEDRQFRDWGLWTGTVWSEAREGTNAIGTCLAEGRPLTVHRDQHFHARNARLSCTTAPVYDHEGRLAAALDVSSCRADLTEGATALIAAAVTEAARRIEERCFREAFPRARIVLADDRAAGALLAIDADDLVVGASRAARQALGITAARLSRPLPAADVLGLPGAEAGPPALAQAERGALQRALARAGGNVSAAAEALGISRATLHRKLRRLGLRGG
ncbi:sigma-54-dependent Fis family transcriptional regulator [Roseomonas nepalensis]|uniref:Sigma-54-dependent Fis family transcriptional regulator n=1 Tax=Muricoccus nepalensis TaxID=1854500 RepID=A0A502GFT2_9PROT|nr:helix-turn-helix domain-containing protein [Roseomonas nepalensis]TPG61167.1 sigma-54-dependent Fis family transcriptional regulator [Roseomonas nepalensis]